MLFWVRRDRNVDWQRTAPLGYSSSPRFVISLSYASYIHSLSHSIVPHTLLVTSSSDFSSPHFTSFHLISPDVTPWLLLTVKVSRSKPHLLAVAPSNIAVDNMIQRIMTCGFRDGDGGTYQPNILRLGAGTKVHSVTLEDLLEHEQAIYSTNPPATALVEGVREGWFQGRENMGGQRRRQSRWRY